MTTPPPRRRKYDRYAITKAEHDAVATTRPYTDEAIGAHTDGARSARALASSVFDEAGYHWPQPPPLPPEEPDLDELEEAS